MKFNFRTWCCLLLPGIKDILDRCWSSLIDYGSVDEKTRDWEAAPLLADEMRGKMADPVVSTLKKCNPGLQIELFESVVGNEIIFRIVVNEVRSDTDLRPRDDLAGPGAGS